MTDKYPGNHEKQRTNERTTEQFLAEPLTISICLPHWSNEPALQHHDAHHVSLRHTNLHLFLDFYSFLSGNERRGEAATAFLSAIHHDDFAYCALYFLGQWRFHQGKRRMRDSIHFLFWVLLGRYTDEKGAKIHHNRGYHCSYFIWQIQRWKRNLEWQGGMERPFTGLVLVYVCLCVRCSLLSCSEYGFLVDGIGICMAFVVVETACGFAMGFVTGWLCLRLCRHVV